MVKYSDDQLDAIFSALGDRTRRAILASLKDGPRTVTDLAEPFKMSLPAVSKHLKSLRGAGLIRKKKDGRIHHCSIVPPALKPADDWLSAYRRFWDESFDRLEDYVGELKDDE